MQSLKKHKQVSDKLAISQGQKKYICLLLLISGFGVFLIFIGNSLTAKEPPVVNNVASGATDIGEKSEPSNNTLWVEEKTLEEELVEILEAVEGVGEVVVKVTLAATAETHYASDLQNSQSETSESLQNGGMRTTKENRVDNTVVMKNAAQGENEPVVLKKTKPEVVGVLVVAEGADNLAVMEQISTAVQVVLAVPSHKINVLPKAKGVAQ